MNSLRNYLVLRIFTFYIVLQTATSALEYGYEKDLADQEFTNYARQSKQIRHDQILSNIHSLFKERTSDNNDNSKSVDDYNDLNFKPKKEDKYQIDEVLSEVTASLDKIKEQLIKLNNDGVLTAEVPVTKIVKRYKRDVDNATEANITSTEKNDTIAITTTENPETVTEPVEVLPVKNENSTKMENLELPNNDVINTTETPLYTRRMITAVAPPPQYLTTASRIKDKLLSYLEDTFNEVERKIKPLTNIKIALSNDDHYRIGYIIATMDTLELNLKKLKNDMILHQHTWDDEKVLDLFDRIKATNTVASTLIESLKKYLPRI